MQLTVIFGGMAVALGRQQNQTDMQAERRHTSGGAYLGCGRQIGEGDEEDRPLCWLERLGTFS